MIWACLCVFLVGLIAGMVLGLAGRNVVFVQRDKQTGVLLTQYRGGFYELVRLLGVKDELVTDAAEIAEALGGELPTGEAEK